MIAAVVVAGTMAMRGAARGDRAVSYRIEPAAEALADRSDARQGLLEKLNRRDRGLLSEQPSLIVPDRWDAEEIAYSPLPHRLDDLAEHRKALVVHQPMQVFGAYEAGRLVRWGPVSSGRRDLPTPSGRFHLNWRSRSRHSTIDERWFMEWYFNFHNTRGLALHQYTLPGEPASHACVRLLERDARWIYDWGEQWRLDPRGWEILEHGTPLWILGRYDFDAAPPWLDPASPHPRIDIPPGAFGK